MSVDKSKVINTNFQQYHKLTKISIDNIYNFDKQLLIKILHTYQQRKVFNKLKSA